MFNKQEYKDRLTDLSKRFDVFIDQEGLQEIAEEANNTISDRAHNFLSNSLDLRGQSLEKHHFNTMKKIALNPFSRRSDHISLDLYKLFNAGYTISADMDIQEDFLSKDTAIRYEIQGMIEKPDPSKYSIGALAVEYPAIYSGEIYKLLSPSGLLSPGNMTDAGAFSTSQSMSDVLAYEVHKKDASNELINTYRCGDHSKQSGITGLANLFSGIFSNYLLGKKTQVSLYMTAEPDFVIRKAHERLTKLLDGLITSKLVRNSLVEYSVEE